ncbi:MAG: hypothetical protein WCS88_01860 [Patescibacteria group bacterium]
MNDNEFKEEFKKRLGNNLVCPYELAWKIASETDMGFGHVYNEITRLCDTGFLFKKDGNVYIS